MKKKTTAFALALLVSASVGFAQTSIKPGFNLFSAEQDVEIGRGSVAQIEQQLPVLRDSEAEQYVNRIGRRLAENAGGPNFPYQFRVINAADINAFALPGGPIYINRGIIDNARNEGEVAGVIAHEIAHVALRHGTHQASKAYAAQAGLSILGGLLGGRVGNNTAQVINAIGGFGLNALFLRFSRELETQADVRGAQILAASGYSPADMAGFFNTLARVDTSKKTSWLSDHPAPPDRISRINREAQLLRVSQTPATNVAELNRVKSSLSSRYGTSPTMQQIARSGPQPSAGRPQTSSTAQVERPSSSFRSFTSPAGIYRLSYPSNWRVFQQGSTGATIAPEGGVASAGGRTEVMYGAIVNHYEGRGTLTEATNDLVGQIRQASPHLGAIRGSSQRFNLDGGAALSVALRGTNPNTGIQERVTLVTRQLADRHLVYMLFVTPEREARNYGQVLQAMVRSMQVDETRRH
jgi:Zn-dependent protease with chaperone function